LNGEGLGNGHPANLTIVDPDAEWTVEPERFASKGKHSAFRGWSLAGRVVAVIRRGVAITGSDPVEMSKGGQRGLTPF